MVTAAGKARHEPAVYRPDCRIARPFDVLHDPGQLGRREVRVEDEPRDLANASLVPGFAEARALGSGSPVLPDDGVAERLQCLAVPHDEGLALVGDADGANVGWPGACGVQRITRGGLYRCPYLVGVVFHPAWLRVVLSNLRVAFASDLAVHADGDCGGASRALVETENYSAVTRVRCYWPGFQTRFRLPVE